MEFLEEKDLEKDEIVAIKQIIKNDGDYRRVNEIKNLKEMSKEIKYSVKYKDHFETEDSYYIIMDYYDNNLENILEECHRYKKKEIPINLTKKIFTQLNMTIKELLKNHIAHRKISPDNILIKYVNEDKNNFDSFLGDYGISEKYNENSYIFGYNGTICFTAPEVLKKGRCRNNCDLLSIWVILYELYWQFHYDDKNGISMIMEIERLGEKAIKKIEENLPLDDLIRKLLKENPKERITWEEYFNHPFFKQYEY